MKKDYSSPILSEFGDIADVTGIFGNPSLQDVLIGPAGEIQEGSGSINACASADFEVCL